MNRVYLIQTPDELEELNELANMGGTKATAKVWRVWQRSGRSVPCAYMLRVSLRQASVSMESSAEFRVIAAMPRERAVEWLRAKGQWEEDDG